MIYIEYKRNCIYSITPHIYHYYAKNESTKIDEIARPILSKASNAVKSIGDNVGRAFGFPEKKNPLTTHLTPLTEENTTRKQLRNAIKTNQNKPKHEVENPPKNQENLIGNKKLITTEYIISVRMD